MTQQAGQPDAPVAPAERNTPGKVLLWLGVMAAALVATVWGAMRTGRPRPLTIHTEIGRAAAEEDLDIARIEQTVRRLAAAESRMTGAPGCGAARDLILRELRAAGVTDIERQPFDVAVPVTARAELTVSGGGAGIDRPPVLHPLWPNLARTPQTPPEGVTGPLVYVGRGTDAELAGKTLAEAVLVMDWDCDDEWLAAGEFGARAVIFRGTDRGTSYTARSKFLTVPANIPRFYVAENDLPRLDALVATGATVTIRAEVAWRNVRAENILARVRGDAPGPDAPPDRRAVVFHAYYDSISVVPDLAPGAEQACGAAVLLELARYFARAATPPARPVYVLFTSAHGEALAGMRHFVGALRSGPAGPGDQGPGQARGVLAGLGRPGLLVGLDLSSRSERFGLFCAGNFRGQYVSRLRPRFSVLGQKLDRFARDRCAEALDAGEPANFVDCVNLTLGRNWWTYFPYQAAFESELPTLAGIPAVTFATLNDDRRYVDTPHDTPDRVRFEMLARQILTAPGRRVGLVHLAGALAGWEGPFVSSALGDYWARAAGRVVWLDQQRDYTPSGPVARSVVFLKTNRGEKFLMGTRGISPVLADADGAFAFDGLATSLANSQFRNCLVEAYGLAERDFLAANGRAVAEYLRVIRRGGRREAGIRPDGSILFAADMARPGEYPWKVPILKAVQNVNLVVFPCRAISLYALTDPREYVELTDVQVLDVATNSPPFQYGHSITDAAEGRAVENCMTLWADPTLRTRLTFGFGFQRKRLVLINNSPDNPTGKGFALGELATVPSMVLRGAEDMWNLDEWRIGRLKANGIRNPRVRKIHAEARAYLDAARNALAARNYRTYRAAASNGWALESKVYGELLDMTNNMIRGVLFYLALLIPFAYCLERLLLAGATIRRRIWGMVGIFAAGFAVLAVAHPAFRFTMTPMIVLLAFVILALAVTVSLLVVGKFDRMLQQRKQQFAGIHEDIRNVGRIAVHAIDLGIANIRRRPRRGALTAATIVLVTFTLLSFTSIVPELSISKLTHLLGEPGVYTGLLARSRTWAALPEPLYDSLRRTWGDGNDGGAVLAARAWFFSDTSGQLSQIDIGIPDPNAPPPAATAPAAAPGRAVRYFTAVALLCAQPTEPAVTGIDRALVAGRWFRSDDEPGIILPVHVARSLGLDASDIGRGVLLFGKELPLLGLLDSAKLDALRDIDGEPITPVNFVLQEQLQAQREDPEAAADTLEEYAHHSSRELAIIPLEYGRRLGATFRSIAVKFPPGSNPDAAAERFARRSNITLLASDGRAVRVYASVETSRLSGLGTILVPMLLGFVMVLGTMLGSVYERRREIFVYNSVGLSPVNVSALFLAESSVYAILGAAVGYLLGQAISKALLATGMLGGLNLNYSAGATVFVTVLTMGIVLLSTLYPARQAFLAAVPETHAPSGGGADPAGSDRLGLWMPFVATEAHIAGMQAYMYEYLDSLQGVTIGQLAVDDLAARLERVDGRGEPVLSFRAWLAPFDLGVSHDVQLRIAFRADRGVWQYHLAAVRFSGDQQNWRRLTPRFLLAVRKQLLMWRILPPDAIEDYCRRGEELFGIEPPPPAAADTPGEPPAE